MKGPYFQITVLAVAGLITFACGGDDPKDDPGGKPGFDCVAMCEHEHGLCHLQQSCEITCRAADALNSESGCQAEYEARARCVFELEACEDISRLCPPDDYRECLETFCAANPSSSIC